LHAVSSPLQLGGSTIQTWVVAPPSSTALHVGSTVCSPQLVVAV
jgi:hypothetical protein